MMSMKAQHPHCFLILDWYGIRHQRAEKFFMSRNAACVAWSWFSSRKICQHFEGWAEIFEWSFRQLQFCLCSTNFLRLVKLLQAYAKSHFTKANLLFRIKYIKNKHKLLFISSFPRHNSFWLWVNNFLLCLLAKKAGCCWCRWIAVQDEEGNIFSG